MYKFRIYVFIFCTQCPLFARSLIQAEYLTCKQKSMLSKNSLFRMVYLLGSSQVQINNKERQKLKYVHSAGESNGPNNTQAPRPEDKMTALTKGYCAFFRRVFDQKRLFSISHLQIFPC